MFPANTKILVIDDMKTMRMVVKKALTTLGFTNLSEADDGETAWPLIEQAAKLNQPFQLIVSDWTMPKMTGLDLLKKVRANMATAQSPFLMVTAESDAAQVKEAIAAGVSNYVMKPFTAELLKEKIEQTWQKHGKNAA